MWLAAAAGAAALLVRASLEHVPSLPWWGAAGALVCLAVVYATRARVTWAPLLLCWLYVAWPVPAPSLALGVGFAALCAVLVEQLERPRFPLGFLDGSIAAAALALYLTTLAPTILPADSGEFQIVGPLLGVAHPPGYALFTLLAKVFSLLPVGEVAWRVNLMGAVTGALTLFVVARTARRLTGSPWAGLAAAAALGVSTTFWAQSTTVNIRTFTILFTALCCEFAVRFLHAPAGSEQGDRALIGLAASAGLGISHHASLAFLLPVFGGAILWHDPGLVRRVRRWPRYLAAALLPFVVDLYIVIRAITGAPFGTGELVDAGRVVDHLLGRGFGGDMFAFARLDRTLWERFLVVGNIYHFQFGGPLLLFAVAGLIWLAFRQRKAAAMLAGVWAVMSGIVATYRAPQSVEYLMPAYVPVALCVGGAVALAGELPALLAGARWGAARPAGALLTAAALVPSLLLGQAHLPSYALLHRDRSARAYAEATLLAAPPDAHILSNWHWYTPLLYLQLVEGRRPDVEITYIYPQGATAMPQAWAQRIAQEVERSDRPLIVTNYYPTYADLPLRFSPLGEAFLVRAGPSGEVPADVTRLDLDFAEPGRGEGSQIRLLGCRVSGNEGAEPGDWVTVDLYWQPLVRLERGYSFFVHLVGADGAPLGQQDRRHDAAPGYEPGAVLVDRYRFPVFLTAAPGAYQLIAGVYFTEGSTWQRLVTDGARDAVPLAQVAVVPARQPPVTMHRMARPVAGGPTLVGVDYDHTLPGQQRVYLHWQIGAQPTLARLYAGGEVVGQVEVPGGAGKGYATVAVDVPPQAAELAVELLAVDGNELLSPRWAWGISTRAPLRLPRSRPDDHYLPFGGKLALVSVDAPAAWPAGGEVRVALRFVGLRPIVLDYVISVSARAEGGVRQNSDGVPALGAIPTFKWIRGSEVTDVHLFTRPVGAGGPIELALNVYDAFTMGELPPMDERIARLGRTSVPLRWVE